MRRGVRDPVCGMKVDPEAAVRLDRDGRMHYFCSEDCREEFERSAAAEVGAPA
jgi:YHS domain-containing protein